MASVVTPSAKSASRTRIRLRTQPSTIFVNTGMELHLPPAATRSGRSMCGFAQPTDVVAGRWPSFTHVLCRGYRPVKRIRQSLRDRHAPSNVPAAKFTDFTSRCGRRATRRESVRLTDGAVRRRWSHRPRLPLAAAGAAAPDQRDLVHRECLVDPVDVRRVRRAGGVAAGWPLAVSRASCNPPGF